MSADPGTPFGTLYSKLTTVTKLTLASAYALYAVRETPQTRVEVGGGLRAMSVDLDLNFAPGALPQARVWVKDARVDPVGAAKVTQAFKDRWHGSLLLDHGGSVRGNTSDEGWQAVATVGYQVNDRWSVLGSYHYLQVDRSEGGTTAG